MSGLELGLSVVGGVCCAGVVCCLFWHVITRLRGKITMSKISTTDKALDEIKTILGKGFYPEATPKVRVVLGQLERSQGNKRVIGITLLIMVCGVFVGEGLAMNAPALLRLAIIGLFGVCMISLFIYLWTGAE